MVTQALGGTVTIQTAAGQLARISRKDAHALGLAEEAAGARTIAVRAPSNTSRSSNN